MLVVEAVEVLLRRVLAEQEVSVEAETVIMVVAIQPTQGQQIPAVVVVVLKQQAVRVVLVL